MGHAAGGPAGRRGHDDDELRSATRADLPAVARLLRARDVARVGVEEFTEEELAHDWAMPGFDLAQDAWVADGPDSELLAYGDVWPDGDGTYLVETAVAPGHEHIEERLLRRAARRAAALADGEAPVLRTMVVATERERAARLAAAGYHPVHTFLRLRLDARDPAPQARWPTGVLGVPFDPARHAREVHAVLSEAFEDHVPATRPGPFERWRHDTLGHPEFDPGCCVLAVDGQHIVGALIARPDGTTGWISTLGVLRSSRGRGVGLALLAEAIGLLRARGLAPIELAVDAASPTGATRLYERAGMRVVRRSDLLETVVEVGGEPSAPAGRR